MARNKQVSQRTKHIDLRYHFIWDFMSEGEDGCAKGKLVKVDGTENFADLMTKNVDGKTFDHLVSNVVKGFKKFRDKYNVNVNQQLGGMSGTSKYEVGEVELTLDHWIRHVKKRGEVGKEEWY